MNQEAEAAFARVAALVARAGNESALRELALSVLVQRAGGELELSVDELSREHAVSVEVAVNPVTKSLRLTNTPCPHCEVEQVHHARRPV